MFSMESYDSLSSSEYTTDTDGHRASYFSDSSSQYSSSSEICKMANTMNTKHDRIQILDTVREGNEVMELMLFKNTGALCQDLRLIPEMPEMCDVKFLVGNDKVPVYGVKSILATRSMAFFRMILSQEKSEIHEAKTQKKKFHLFSKLRKITKQSKDSDVSLSGKRSSGHLTIDMEKFDPDTFRRVVVYLHSGNISVSVHSVIGVMNAADIYDLEDLRSACFQFACRCINLRTVLQLFTSTRPYSDSKWTKYIITKIFDFMNEHADCVLRLSSFEKVPKEVAILILAKQELRATEETKWDAALNWSRRYCMADNSRLLRDTLNLFTPRIDFCDIPLSKLTQEIRSLSVLPDDVIDRAIEFKSRSEEERMSSPTAHQRLVRGHSVLSLTSVKSNESLVRAYLSQGSQYTDSGISFCSSESRSLLSNIW